MNIPRTSWWGHPGGIRGGLTGLVVQSSTVIVIEKTQIKPRTLQKMIRIETSLHPRRRKMLEAISQRGGGSSGLRDEDESWNVIHHCGIEPFFTSCGISYWGLCNDHISARASALVVVLDSLVGFLSERKEWVCVLA